MNIVLACNNDFAPYAAEVIASVSNHDKGVSFFLLSDDLNSENEIKLLEMTRSMGNILYVIHVNSDLFKGFPMPQGDSIKHIGISTYFRLFVPILLPKDVDKIIYLDCDIVVRKSIRQLFETNIDAYYLGAVFHSDDLSINNGAFTRLKIPIEQGYFNAGVLLINLKKWREDNIYEKCINYLYDHADKILNHDQDVLNAVCGSKVKLLPCTWNCTNSFFYKSFMTKSDKISKIYQKEVDETITNPAIVHFSFRPKPWEIICVHPYRKDFLYFLALTPFKNTHFQKMTLHDIIEFILKPQFMGYGRYRKINKI